jgi:hypothetical protein
MLPNILVFRVPLPSLILIAASLLATFNNSAGAQQPGQGAQPPGSSTQVVSLQGQVRHEDGTPFGRGAIVQVESEQGGMAAEVQTDSAGKFEVDMLQKDRYTVTVHAGGFVDAQQEADLDTFPHAYLVFTLKPAPGANGVPASPISSDPMVSAADLAVPPGAQSEFVKGRKLLVDEHKPKDSIELFKKAIQLAPNYPLAYFLLGTAYMDDQKWGDAEDALSKAIANNDKLGPAYLALGSCLNAEKKFADAEKPLLKGLDLIPDSAQGQYELGWTYYSLDRWQDADPHVRKSLALDSTFAPAHLVMGNILLRERDGKDAYHEFNEYLRLDPKGQFADATRDLVKRLDKALTDSGIAH